jgi:hypothetical protein
MTCGPNWTAWGGWFQKGRGMSHVDSDLARESSRRRAAIARVRAAYWKAEASRIATDSSNADMDLTVNDLGEVLRELDERIVYGVAK